MAAKPQTTDTPHALPRGEIGVWRRIGPQENSQQARSQNTSVQAHRVVILGRFEDFDHKFAYSNELGNAWDLGQLTLAVRNASWATRKSLSVW
jgi:hypothetical protein